MSVEERAPGDTLSVVGYQWAPGPDVSRNREEIAHLVAEAVSQGAELVVFPEYAHYWDGAPSPSWHPFAEDLAGEFVAHLCDLSVTNAGIAIVAGMLEKHPDGKPFNTLVAVSEGLLVARSRKIHLYDAFSAKESAVLDPAPREDPAVFFHRGLRIGLQTCYDLRFPEVTRRLVDSGAQLVVIPSQWVPGPDKIHQWQTLLRARAIESQLFVLAVDHPAPHGVGYSMMVNPRGYDLAQLGEEPGQIIAEVSLAQIDEIRRVNPMGALRRFRVDWI